MKNPIAIGMPVEFDSDHGPQAGVVEELKADLGNGRRIAMIRVSGTLNGAPWSMPLDQLQHATARA
ncbi:hypothetical protein [Janthinobacterium sp.]|uniref:hypothetical protein n=1 Tax=Janthinobacterium sp. TaxID=1871054 RepID=UPI00293D8879|nr:hypothetical protein [Janthinobacterium sp.]